MPLKFKGLVISGGHSTRMKQDKTKLQIKGQSLRTRAFLLLQTVCDEVFVSVRTEQIDSELQKEFSNRLLTDQHQDIGPAAALLRAFAEDPEASWLVLACDYVMADHKAVEQLIGAAETLSNNEVFAFVHMDGTPDPLFAVWTPKALHLLKAEVEAGRTGPLKTLLKSKHQLVRPLSDEILMNVNAPEDWEQIQARLDIATPSKS